CPLRSLLRHSRGGLLRHSRLRTSNFLPPFPRSGFASRPFHRSPRHRYYEGSDSCRPHPTGRSPRVLRLPVPALPTPPPHTHPLPHGRPATPLAPPCPSQGQALGPRFRARACTHF